jgi:ribosomal protein L37AE/L43A
MTTHPHSANQIAGSKWDNKLRSDVNGMPSAIGHHFGLPSHHAPMVHNSPVSGLTTHHDVIECPACSASILWNGSPVLFMCEGCGGTIDGATLAGQ